MAGSSSARAVLLVLVASAQASALPRFAARMGAACSACHVNPTGAGMRNAFGRNVFERHQLPQFPAGNADEPFFFSPEVNEHLSIGSDVRWDYLWEPKNGGGNAINSFFPMQADLYLFAELGQRAGLYVDIGVHGNAEVFGLVRAPEWAGLYLKVGAFVPPYGLKLDNHRAYIRALTVGEPPADRDAAVEIGIQPGRFSVHAAVFNGAFETASPADQEGWKGVSCRAEARFRPGPVRLAVGVSGLFNRQEQMRKAALGAYAMASLGRFTYLGEVDYLETQDISVPEAFRDTIAQLVTFHELSMLLFRGFDLKLSLESADLDLQASPNQVTRMGIGVEYFPVELVGLSLQYRRLVADPSFVLGTGERVDGDQDLAVVFHFFF